MKLCNKCKTREVRAANQYTCASCHNEYQKDYYKRNPKSIDSSNERRKLKIRSIIVEEKNKPCMDCGGSYPYYVMDFDHVRGEKKFNLSIAAQKIYSLKKIQDEISKCEVVCANCHRERTFKRQKNFQKTIDG